MIIPYFSRLFAVVDIFKEDPDFQSNEEKYKEVKSELLGSSDSEGGGSSGSDSGSGSDSDDG